MQRILIVVGLVFLAAGFAWFWLARIPFGHLPGDIYIVREGFRYYFPITTCIFISFGLPILFWLLRR
ncbi:hypothetical protein BG58_16445 [Caballeronia jiangsuensis]|nr:hypothetical protein BG58_16445 [Caballeronia jiangsuensis]